jgi:hypothetical protein
MSSKRDRNIVHNLQSKEHFVEPLTFDMDALEDDKELVLQSIADLAESGLGVLHQPSDEIQHLYLVTGGVFHLGLSGVTRLS